MTAIKTRQEIAITFFMIHHLFISIFDIENISVYGSVIPRECAEECSCLTELLRGLLLGYLIVTSQFKNDIRGIIYGGIA
jgi:hypothetical protein